MKEKTEVEKVTEAIIYFENKIKAQGMIINARDDQHLKKLKIYLTQLKNLENEKY